jgi:hypothetical protein
MITIERIANATRAAENRSTIYSNHHAIAGCSVYTRDGIKRTINAVKNDEEYETTVTTRSLSRLLSERLRAR